MNAFVSLYFLFSPLITLPPASYFLIDKDIFVFISIPHFPYRKHSVSITTTNWLTLFREIIAVQCENHKEHTNTLCGQNAVFTNPVRTSQETIRLHNNAQPVNAV
jgi:hypothetical protein